MRWYNVYIAPNNQPSMFVGAFYSKTPEDAIFEVRELLSENDISFYAEARLEKPSRRKLQDQYKDIIYGMKTKSTLSLFKCLPAQKEITQEDYNFLISKMENEGFDYCFKSYSDWKEISDIKFHILRNKYLESMQNLKDYIQNDLKKNIEDE